MKVKHLCAVLLLAFTASSALGFTHFTEAEDQLWTNANNWSTFWLPASDETTHIGGMSGVYADVTCIVPAGSSVVSGELRVGYNFNGTLIVEEGATLTTTSHTQFGAGTGGGLGTAVINGNLHAAGWTFSAGGNGPADVTIGPNAVITIDSAMNFGQEYHEGYGYDVTITQNGGTIQVGDWVAGNAFQMRAHGDAEVVYSMSNGAVLSAPSIWQNSGTLEFEGTATLTGGGVRFAGFDGKVPTIKAIGTDPVLTIDGGRFSDGVLLDVSELSVTANQWVTIVAGGYLTDTDLSLAPGTDANIWQLRVNDGDSGDVEVYYSGSIRIMGDVNLSGYVDDDDLSLLLANWNTNNVWEYGNLSDPYGTVGYVDDDDLSLLLANWNAGSLSAAPQAVPEPASALILLLGLPYLARRRMRR